MLGLLDYVDDEICFKRNSIITSDIYVNAVIGKPMLGN